MGEAKVDVGEVDQYGDIGAVLFDGGDEATIRSVDTGHVADDLGDAHVGNVLGADDAIEAGVFHLLAPKTEVRGVGVAASQLGDELRSVVVAAGFAG